MTLVFQSQIVVVTLINLARLSRGGYIIVREVNPKLPAKLSSLAWRFNYKLVIRHNPGLTVDGSTGQRCWWAVLFFVILLNINAALVKKKERKQSEGERVEAETETRRICRSVQTSLCLVCSSHFTYCYFLSLFFALLPFLFFFFPFLMTLGILFAYGLVTAERGKSGHQVGEFTLC